MHPHEFKDLIGIPFVHNGRDPKTGLDCYGLTREAVRRFGRELPDFSVACYDAMAIHMKVFDQVISTNWERLASPIPGCVVAMAIDPVNPLAVQHLGVYLGEGIVLHTLEKRESSTFNINSDALNDKFFTKKIRGFFSWKNH